MLFHNTPVFIQFQNALFLIIQCIKRIAKGHLNNLTAREGEYLPGLSVLIYKENLIQRSHIIPLFSPADYP